MNDEKVDNSSKIRNGKGGGEGSLGEDSSAKDL